MQFDYKAIDPTGRVQVGSVEAPTRARALLELAAMRLIPVALDAGQKPKWLNLRRSSLIANDSLSTRDLVSFTVALASLLKAGLMLDRALSISSATSDRPAVKRLCEDLERRVRSGASFASALEQHRRMFPNYYITMIRAGEVGGSLADGLAQLGSFIERAAAVRERIVASLIYPLILVAMILLTLGLVLTVVLPKFQSLFSEAQATLPLPTRLVLHLGNFAHDYGAFFVAAAVVGIMTIAWAHRHPYWGPELDRKLVQVRWTRDLVTKTQSSRFLRTLGTLTGNGVPIPQAMGVALGVLSNRALRKAGETIHERLKQGEDLSHLFDEAQVFPKSMVQLTRVGEETGRLHHLLLEAADALDREAQATIDRSLSVLVPAVTIGMGVLVAALIGSVLVGILSLNDLAF